LPLRLVEVAQELTAAAREAYLEEGPEADPVDRNTLFWWSDVKHLQRHLERLHRAVTKLGNGDLKEDSHCEVPCFTEQIGRALFFQRAAENLAKATADWSKYEVQEPHIQDLVRQLERAVQLGRQAGDAQREEQRAQDEEEQQSIDEPEGEDDAQELYLEESRRTA